ncbi:hypothetical protein imdm_2371 [gamma proteobacterium IMCC2047]|nr:hypothetical protein imdm_2371 [gamma proteobacterium IMCC2047]
MMNKPTINSGIADDSAYVSLATLLRCRLFARDLKLSHQRKILSQQAGLHISKFRGRGVDFSEVRAYQQGDDIRSIDWRVTARTGKAHTKLYAEEREHPTLVIVDQSTSMFFGSRVAFKSVVAAQLAALIVWATLQRGDRSGGIIFSDTKLHDIKPRRSRHTVLGLLEQLVRFNHALNCAEQHQPATSEQTHSFADALQHARRTCKPGSELFIISDFQHINNDTQRHLFQLARHNDVVCLKVEDPMEAELPQPGLYNISDGKHRTQIDLGDKTLRSRYQQSYQQQLQALQQHFDQLKIPLLQISTDDNPLRALQQGLGIRTRKRRA